MSFLADLISKAKGLLDDTAPPPTETAAIKSTWFDRHDWDKTRQLPVVANLVREMDQTIDHVADFAADLHSALYKVDPHLREAHEMAPTHVANREIFAQFLDMPEVTQLRQHSVADTYGTAMSMVAVQEPLVETAERVYRVRREAAERAAQAEAEHEQAMEDLRQKLAELENLPEGEDPGDPGDLGDLIDKAHEARERSQEIIEDGNHLTQQIVEAAAPQIRTAAKQADEQLNEENALANGFGIGPGELQRMNVEERVRLAKKLRGSRLAKFASLIGQFKAVQRAESRRRVVNASSEIHGVTYSDRFDRLTAGEYLNFADESLQTLMLVRWAEHNLLTYDVRGKEKLGQGPIVAVVDESGSMMATDMAGSSREAWAKGLALALCDQARRRGRDFVYIGFASASQQRTLTFPKGEAPLERVLDMTETLLNGGTHYETPLNMALKIVESYPETSGRPDVVFITDDQYGQMSPEFMHHWVTTKERLSLKCYGIAVGCDVGVALNQVSDNVRSIVDLVSDPTHVGDLFRTI